MTLPLLRWRDRSAKRLCQHSFKLPLRLALVIPFVLLAGGAVGLVGYLSWNSGQKAIQDVVNRLQQEISRRIEQKLITYLETPHLINQLNAEAVRRGQLKVDDRASERYLWQQTQLFKDVSWIYYGAQHDGSFIGVLRPQPGQPPQIVVNNPSTHFQGRYYSTDSQGNRLQQVKGTTEIYDARTRPWYQTALKAGRASWSPIYSDFASPHLITSAVLPVHDASGRMLGVVGTDLDLENISYFLKHLDISQTGQAFVIERSGLLVASSTSENPYWVNPATQTPQRLQAIDSTNSLLRSTVHHLAQEFGNLSNIRGEQQLAFQLNGTRQLIRVLPFQDHRGINWLIVVAVPESDFMAQIYVQQRTTLLLCALTLAGTIALGLLISRSIAKPIQQLSQASQRLADGHWQKRFKQTSPIAELQVLNLAFTQMAAQLQQSFDRVKTALQETEEKFTKVFRTCPDPIGIVTPDGHYVDVNDAFIHLFGYSRDEVIGHSGVDMGHWVQPEDRNHYVRSVQAAGRVQNQEYLFRKKTGELLTVLFSAESIELQGQQYFIGIAKDITDRKQAEAALRQSEAALRRAQQVAHVGSWSVEVETGKVTWSEESFHIFGWNLARLEPTLTQFYDLVHPDDRTLLQHSVEQTIATKAPYKTEFRIIQPDGSSRYVEARGEAIVDQRQQVVQLIGTNLDITERKLAEAALRQSESIKNQILKAIPDLILWMTADGICIDLIEGNSQISLYDQAEAVGKNLYALLPPDLAQARMTAVQHAINTHEVQRYEQQVSVGTQIRDEEVRVVNVGKDRVLVIVRDITDRKRTEAALQDSEARFRHAFHDAPIGMALIGLDDRWLKVNPMLCDMLGYSEFDLLSMSTSMLVHPDDRTKFWQCAEQLASYGNRTGQIELRYCCQQGHVVGGLVSLSLVRDVQQQPLYYVAQIQDITEQQAIDRMKHEFISIVSHELRTPLTAIRGFLGLLNTGIYDNKPNKAKHMIGQALSNSDRLVRLVNDILDLERLSSGKVQLVMEACEAEELMRRAVEGVQSIADEAAVILSVVPTSVRVWAAPDSIIQTLTNLLSNAIKFSPPRAIVFLSAQSQADSALFQVKDQGRGIPADKLETIFDRFQQVDVSDARQKRGTGLGLAICQSIVQQHGGNIWAESNLGEGSCFCFTLPLLPGDQP
jgi:PAS domain S-box-containing protein